MKFGKKYVLFLENIQYENARLKKKKAYIQSPKIML